MSYSYPSGPPSSGNIYQRSSSIDYETGAGSFIEPAPTRSTVRNRNNVPQVVSQRNLNGEANHGQGPSFTSEPLNHQPFPDQGKSINEPFKGDSYGYGEKAPSVGAMRQFIASDLSGGNMYPYSDGQPPSLTDVARRDASQTGSSYTSNEGSVPQPGMSLTGKNFSKYHPGAFHKDN